MHFRREEKGRRKMVSLQYLPWFQLLNCRSEVWSKPGRGRQSLKDSALSRSVPTHPARTRGLGEPPAPGVSGSWLGLAHKAHPQ